MTVSSRITWKLSKARNKIRGSSLPVLGSFRQNKQCRWFQWAAVAWIGVPLGQFVPIQNDKPPPAFRLLVSSPLPP